MVMSVYSRTSAYTALRPAGHAARTRVVQPVVHRNSPDDHAPDKGHDDERRRTERGVNNDVRPEVRAGATR